MRFASLLALTLVACSSDPEPAPEPDYIGPCLADEEYMLPLPGPGCFRVESPYSRFAPRGTHPCEADSTCAIVDWDGTGDTGWSMFSGRSNPPAPTVTPAQCGSRC